MDRERRTNLDGAAGNCGVILFTGELVAFLRFLGIIVALVFWIWVFATWGMTAAWIVGGILVIGLLAMIYEKISGEEL